MPPSLSPTASAWESPAPGSSGRVNGSCVAGPVDVDAASAGAAVPEAAAGVGADDGAELGAAAELGAMADGAPGSPSAGALRASGASPLTRIVGLSPSRPPLTT